MRKRLTSAIAALAIAAAPLTSYGFGDGTGFKTGSCELGSSIVPGSGEVLKVGLDKAHVTIQSAVNAANEGDHIVIDEGEYKEAVKVTTPGLRITGKSRTGVVLNGENTKTIGFEVTADRVVIENMTGHHYTRHVFYWLSSTGYWGRYLTAYNAGFYGIFAYDSRCGQLDNSYASGTADSGFYIGECYPCDTVITRIEASGNGLGFSGTNAGGNLLLKDSWWHDNALGIVPNSLDAEAAPPQRGITIENNLVENNSDITAPGTGAAADFYGIGIAIAGGSGNHIIGNTVRGHKLVGIVLSPLVGTNSFLYVPGGNMVWGNKISQTGVGAAPGESLGDMAQGATSAAGNCWDHNEYTTAAPEGLETIWGCTNTDTDTPKLPYYVGHNPPGGDPRVEVGLVAGAAGLNGRNASVSPWQTWPVPTCGANPNSCIQMPDENGDSSYGNDAGVDLWLPALL